jgi:hypothetical protein
MSFKSAKHCSARADAAPLTPALGGGNVYLRTHVRKGKLEKIRERDWGRCTECG